MIVATIAVMLMTWTNADRVFISKDAVAKKHGDGNKPAESRGNAVFIRIDLHRLSLALRFDKQIITLPLPTIA